MSICELREDQVELVRAAAKKHGFEQVDIVAKTGSIKGDNYLGIIYTVELTSSSGTQQQKLYLILKSAHTNETFRKNIPISNAFAREAFLYGTIIPKFKSYQKQFNISSPFTGSAGYYGSHLEELKESILMQNLKEYGYQLWDRMKPMDSQHISLVFCEYARYHAISLALKNNSPETFEELTKDIHLNIYEEDDDAEDEEKSRAIDDMYFKTGLEAVKGNDKATRALERLQGRLKELFEDLNNQESDRFVVTHGDSWCNNMLFKYEEANQSTPTQVCFIDWQLSKLGSPIMDLSYFFSVCGSKEVYPNLTDYLRQYHQILSRNLKEFGCDPEEICSFETLLEDWKRNCWYGVFVSMLVIKVMLTDSEEAPIISNGEKTENGVLNVLTGLNMSRTGEFSRRLCDLVEFMVDNDYI